MGRPHWLPESPSFLARALRGASDSPPPLLGRIPKALTPQPKRPPEFPPPLLKNPEPQPHSPFPKGSWLFHTLAFASDELCLESCVVPHPGKLVFPEAAFTTHQSYS